jgi:hypothetical protein
MKLLSLDRPELLKLVAGSLAEKENYQRAFKTATF